MYTNQRWLPPAFMIVPCSSQFQNLRWRNNVPLKRRSTYKALHGIVSNKNRIVKCFTSHLIIIPYVSSEVKMPL